jgi:hypothetical protein
MHQSKQRELFSRLLKCKTSASIKAVLDELGDGTDSTLDVPFGGHSLVWRAFGGRESNISSIGLGTKPGRSLTERLTNAIDAVLEDRVVTGVAPPDSPRAAALQWFGRPQSTADSGLFKWDSKPADFDRHIHVVIQASESEGSPTLDVIDDGVGIKGVDFPSTILSLQGGNKIRKRYLIGTFGQGGAATLDFCEYALIFSRSKHDRSKVAFTVIRVLKLDQSFKEDCYAYLGVSESDLTKPLVFETDIGANAVSLYPGVDVAQAPVFEKGTVVRHISYRLGGLDKGLHSSPGNLYHYLHYTIVDPIIPFRLLDLRPNKPKNEYVGGARNRLMAKAIAPKIAAGTSTEDDEDDEKGVQLRHYRPMEYVVPSGSYDACVGIEYWVVFGFRKKGKGGDRELRSHSNELYVQQGYPIVGSLNGQNQGEYSWQLVKQLGLNLTARHLVVHIDASAADHVIRRQLFSTNREGFKDGPVLESILAMLRKILSEDKRLFEIEQELTQRLTQRDVETAKSEVKSEVSRLLKEAGLSVRDEGKVDVEGGRGEKKVVEREGKSPPLHREPLPTLPFPNVTRFEIVYPLDLFQIPLNDTQNVVVETDADAAYDSQVRVRSEPLVLEVATRAPLRGGRVRWRLRPVEGAPIGSTGEVIVTLTKPDGTQMTSRVLFEVVPPIEKEARRVQGHVPPFDILPVSPDNHELWSALWEDDNDDPVEQAKHAYKILPSAGKTVVYYSTVFEPFRATVEKLKNSYHGRLAAFETHYQIWVGYHAILQSQRLIQEKSGVTAEALEQIQEQERQTVAQMQIKVALRLAEMAEQRARTGTDG